MRLPRRSLIAGVCTAAVITACYAVVFGEQTAFSRWMTAILAISSGLNALILHATKGQEQKQQ